MPHTLDDYLKSYEQSFHSGLFFASTIWVYQTDYATLNADFKRDISLYWDQFGFAEPLKADWYEFVKQTLCGISAFGDDHRNELIEFLRSAAI